MSFRTGSSLRTKIVAVLASLVALWAFAAVVTVREGVNVVWFATLEQKVGKSTEAVVAAIQSERRASVAAVAAVDATGRASHATQAGLDATRATTDEAIRDMMDKQRGTFAQWSMQGSTHARLGDFQAGLATLTETRARIDAGDFTPNGTSAYFTGLVHQAEAVYDTFTVWDDATVIYQTSTLVMMTQVQDMMSEEDALMAGILGTHQFTDDDRASFAQDLGVAQYLTTSIDRRLTGEDRVAFEKVFANDTIAGLRTAEDAIVHAPTGRAPDIDPARWHATITSAIDALRRLILTLADLTVTRTQGAVIWVVVRLVLAAGLGLIAVIAAIRFSIRTVRALQAQLVALRTSALDLAQVRLPRVVEQLRKGEDVDVDAAAPPLAHGSDDIGQVGAAFNLVQETAIRATVEQAELRRGVRDVFLNLARRSQAIVHRQLKLLDAMERRASTDVELGELFRVDHLATRMRRNAENLIVLSGSVAGRAWRAPVPMVDVIRGALAEIEEYTRVSVRSVVPATLTGRAVGDVIHLLAELMENAVSFSPPNTVVNVVGERTSTGYVIGVEDRGLGMPAPDLADANSCIADPPEFQLSATPRLGFYVVGRLAQRHQIEVRLRTNAYNGTTATVTVPAALIEHGANGSEPVQATAQPARDLIRATATGWPAADASTHARGTRPAALAASGSASSRSAGTGPGGSAASEPVRSGSESSGPASSGPASSGPASSGPAVAPSEFSMGDLGRLTGDAGVQGLDANASLTPSGLPRRVRKPRPIVPASGLSHPDGSRSDESHPNGSHQDGSHPDGGHNNGVRAGGARTNGGGSDRIIVGAADSDKAATRIAGIGPNGHGPSGRSSDGHSSDGHGLDPHGLDGHGLDPHGLDPHNLNGSAPNGLGLDEHGSNGHGSNGHGSNGHGSNGHGSNGHSSNGHSSNGHSSNGHAPDGADVAVTSARGISVARQAVNGSVPRDRDPAETRRRMAAYQEGARRGRSEAERGLVETGLFASGPAGAATASRDNVVHDDPSPGNPSPGRNPNGPSTYGPSTHGSGTHGSGTHGPSTHGSSDGPSTNAPSTKEESP